MKYLRSSLRLAIQKSGRLFDQCRQLLEDCGVSFDHYGDSLLRQARGMALELLLVRDDDIPELLNSGVCDLGIVGANVYQERLLYWQARRHPVSLEQLMGLGFARCRLTLAAPQSFEYRGPQSLAGCSIATSYPELLDRFLTEHKVRAESVVLSGAIEIAPRLQMADVICDLVSTGGTLRANGLVELETIYQSEAVLLRSQRRLSTEMEALIDSLTFRIEGAQRGESNRYLMLHCARQKLSEVCRILPGSEGPTVLQLQGRPDLVVVHAVCPVSDLWDKIEELKRLGASSLLVLPIERAIIGD